MSEPWDGRPPRAAVDAMEIAIAQTAGRNYTCAEDVRSEIVSNLRALPAADRWAFIAWLAEGLEPTDAMTRAVAYGRYTSFSYGGNENGFEYVSEDDAARLLIDMLAAAREADDAR